MSGVLNPFPAFSKEYVSAEVSIVVGGLTTLTHGLGVIPKFVDVCLRCKIAEYGYSINNEIRVMGPSYSDGVGEGNKGLSFLATTGTIGVQIGSAAVPEINRKSAPAGDLITLTPANWRVIVRAWA